MGAERRGARKPLLFRVAALAVAGLVLLGIELALRETGVAGPQPLFEAVPGRPALLQANPRLIERYVSGASGVHAYIDAVPFPRDKDPETLRIVVQGGSTAAGFPFGRWAGLAGMLDARLEGADPDRPFEVIPTALAAVNSYTLLDLVAEIIAIEPDVVLVYAGHNEYLGLLGVGSTLARAGSYQTTRLRLLLRRLAIQQSIDAAITRLRASGTASGDRATLFARAAGGAHIPYESAAYWRGVAQLEANLGELLRRYREAGIPVYVGTLVSNLRDLPPFVGGRADDPASAGVRFAAAREAEAAGRLEEALAGYRAARDRDQLRFRAPSLFNERIRALAQQHDARVVDVEAHFSAASPNGIPGGSLLLEHVHPNAEGYFLLADSYYDALVRDGRVREGPRALDEAAARREMPLTALDRVLGSWDTLELRSGPPFRDAGSAAEPVGLPEPRNAVERLAQRVRSGALDWTHAMDELMQGYRRAGRVRDAARVARIVARSQPFNEEANLAAGLLELRLDRPHRALRYLERADASQPRTRAALQRARAAIEAQDG